MPPSKRSVLGKDGKLYRLYLIQVSGHCSLATLQRKPSDSDLPKEKKDYEAGKTQDCSQNTDTDLRSAGGLCSSHI